MRYSEIAYGDERQLDGDDIRDRVARISQYDLSPLCLSADVDVRNDEYVIYVYHEDDSGYIAAYTDIDQFEHAVRNGLDSEAHP